MKHLYVFACTWDIISLDQGCPIAEIVQLLRAVTGDRIIETDIQPGG